MFKNLFVKTYVGCMKSFTKAINDLEKMISQRDEIEKDLQLKRTKIDIATADNAMESDMAYRALERLEMILGVKRED